MTARSPGAFLLSAGFHAAVVLLLFVLGVVAQRQSKELPRVLELVAGEGDNFMATEAPALGSPGGVKLEVPAMPAPKAPEPVRIEPPPPAKIEPPPPEPVATPPPKAPPAPVKKADPPVPNFVKQILRKTLNAERAAKREVAKERAAEEKRMKKEEFDRLQREKARSASTPKGTTTPKIAKIDAEGIAKGVVGGSTNNKVGGAGGKALVATNGAATERYYAMLVQRVKAAIDKPPGISDGLAVSIGFRVSASGAISNVRVLQSSGSEEWDEAVVAAFRRVGTMPPHPEKKNEDAEVTFETTEVPSR